MILLYAKIQLLFLEMNKSLVNYLIKPMYIISLTCSKESVMSGSLREGLRPRVDLACKERRVYLNIIMIYKNMA